MSWLFITAVVILIIGGIVTIVGLLANNDDYSIRRPTLIVAGIIVTIGVALTIATCFTSVPAQSVGVVLNFGKPVAAYDSGIHTKAPWWKVVDMDGRIQIDDNRIVQDGENKGDHRTEIRLGNQANAYVQNSIRWKIKPEGAERLYADYRDDERIGPGLVEPELAAALNAAFANYDPLKTAEGGQSYDAVASQVKNNLTNKIGDRIIIESVIIPKVDFDDATQNRINALQQEIGKTRIAEQSKRTAQAEADANRTLASSVSKDPNVLVSKCIDMVSRGVPVPPGFQCWPNTGGNTIVGR